MWEGFADSPNSFGGKFDISSTIAMVHRERPQLAVESYAWDSYVKPVQAHRQRAMDARPAALVPTSRSAP